MQLSELRPDSKNANRGTDRGRKMLNRSLRELGAGRSILLDRAGRIIAGNKTVEQAAAAGFSEVQIIQSDGGRIIAVQRTDLDLERDEKARQLAIADNRTSETGLEWDAAALEALAKDTDLSALFADDELAGLLGPRLGPELNEHVADGISICICEKCGHEHHRQDAGPSKRPDAG